MIAAAARDFASWRLEARRLLQAEIAPAEVLWESAEQPSLFGRDSAAPSEPQKTDVRNRQMYKVPPAFLAQAEVAADCSDRDTYAVLYRLLWKLVHGQAQVLADPLDPDAQRLTSMQRQVREEEHRMHAFVRFRQTKRPDGREHAVAWYAPEHPVLRRVAPFFARRYPAMPWTLMTPEATATWDGSEITFGPGAPRENAPAENELDDLFLAYYASVYNPARTNVQVMQQHLTSRIRAQLPEGRLAPVLARASGSRVRTMQSARASASARLVPAPTGDRDHDFVHLCQAAAACRACPIGEKATQTVFGEGPRNARLMLVGEQPGDEEDRAGHPFIGPAGRLLGVLLERAEIDRQAVYVTNAVKHFKWEPRGKRRLHARPQRDEIDACRGWLLAEVELVKPEMILCLGATAAQSFAGPQFRVQRDRGRPSVTPWAPWWMATYHPSALLRAADEASRASMERDLLADLVLARQRMAASAA